MRRRDFIAIAGATAGWPVAARVQQKATPVIGFLSARSPQDTTHLVEAFRGGLSKAGFVEGHNVTVEYRWALGQYDRVPALAAELASIPVAVFVTTGGEGAALAAKTANPAIPIAFIIGIDPVKVGLAASYSRPGGNATGINIRIDTLELKRLEILHDLVPQASTIGALFGTFLQTADHEPQLREFRGAARALNLQVQELYPDTDAEIDLAFETAQQRRIPALTVSSNVFYDTRRDKLVALAARHMLPTMYQFREFPVAGGLISYGPDARDYYRQIGVYAGAILNGKKPGELPILEPTKFELVINLKAAKSLGLDVPQTLLSRADEVIE
jgi:putative ABC transport system substrate-binding protein